MAHITINTVLQAEIYNHLLIDYNVTKEAARLHLKLFPFFLSNVLDLPVLRRSTF
jgi:hypothetical protein